MPLYEYKCHSCGKTFEVIQKFSDEPLAAHIGCGGEVERLLSAPAFHLKGTGWYATDYAKSNGSTPKTDDSKSDSKPKTESKTENAGSATETKPSLAETKPSVTSSDSK
jgi:putative FmdB family regulatory protein